MRENTNANRFERLYSRLRSNELSQKEHEEFLNFVADAQNEEIIQEALDQRSDEFGMVPQYERRTARIRSLHKRRWAIRWAASLLLLMGVLSILWQFELKRPDSLVYSTSNGEILELLLPDSSIVKLNANSKLEWCLEEGNVRQVLLDGEAFFEVRHLDNNSSFVVQTKNARIRVLGTSFNVNSRLDLDKVFLEEGSIQLESVDSDQILLDPGEGAVVHSEDPIMRITDVDDLRNEVAWKDGLLRFSGVRLLTIIDRLEEIYGKEIRVMDPLVLDTEMEFTLPYSDWEVTGQALALAVGLEVIEIEGHIVIQ